MFGTLRFLLAYLVVLSHLVGSEYVAHFGFYAVHGFFVISGFVMTAALNEIYHFDGVRFWLNRALRLLPPYYLVSMVTLAAIALAPHQAGAYLKFWKSDPQLHDVLINLTVLPLQFPNGSFRLIPPFWSVALEVDMYLLLYLVIARSVVWALVGLAAGIAYHWACSHVGWGWGARYFTAPSAILPFAAGALIYFLHKRELVTWRWRAAGIAFAAWFANMLVGGWIFPDAYVFGIGFYLDTALFGIVVGGLAGRDPGPVIRRVDKTLGEWAYFVFLVHWLAGFLIVSILLPGQWRGWMLAFAVLPVVVVAAAGLAVVNRRFVEPLRHRVRHWQDRNLGGRALAAASGGAIVPDRSWID